MGGWGRGRVGGSGTPAGRAEELFRNGWASLAGRPTGTSKVTRPIPNASPPYPPSTYFLLDSGSWQVKHRPRHPARNQELTPPSFHFILYLLPVPTSCRVYLLSFSQNNPLPPPLPPPPTSYPHLRSLTSPFCPPLTWSNEQSPSHSFCLVPKIHPLLWPPHLSSKEPV